MKLLIKYLALGLFLGVQIPLTFLLAQPVEKAKINQTKAPVRGPEKGFYGHYLVIHNELIQNNTHGSPVAPEALKVTAHNFGLGYQFNNRYSANISTSYNKNVFYLDMFGKTLISETKGLGDASVELTHHFIRRRTGHTDLSLGLNLPTGSYKEKSESGRISSFQGQLGSGTYDLSPLVTYRRRMDKWSFKGKLGGTIRTGRNDLKYRLGNVFATSVSANYRAWKYLSVVGRAKYKGWGKVIGANNVAMYNASLNGENKSRHRSNSIMSTDSSGEAGARWGTYIGLSTGIFLNHKIIAIIEAGTPIYSVYVGDDSLKGNFYLTSFVRASF